MQCSGKSRHGTACKAKAIRGGSVCVAHGGAAPQVRRAAEVRLLEMVSPSLSAISGLLKRKDAPATQLGAAKDVLDRVGIGVNAQRALEPGQERVTVSWEMYREIERTDPERWARIQQLARELGNSTKQISESEVNDKS